MNDFGDVYALDVMPLVGHNATTMLSVSFVRQG